MPPRYAPSERFVRPGVYKRNTAITNRRKWGVPVTQVNLTRRYRIDPQTGKQIEISLPPMGPDVYSRTTTESLPGKSFAATPDTSTLQSQYQQAMDKANAANEARYQEILQGLEGMGDQSRADIKSRWSGQATQGYQDLVSRGLTGTTVAPSLAAGYERGKSADLNRLDETLRAQKFGFMERRTDAQPDMGLYAQMAMAQGAAGSGGDYGGGGGSYAQNIAAAFGQQGGRGAPSPYPGGYNPFARGPATTAGPTIGGPTAGAPATTPTRRPVFTRAQRAAAAAARAATQRRLREREESDPYSPASTFI